MNEFLISEVVTIIETCESSLLSAIKSNDLNVIDALLHTDLLFTGPDGITITKAVDMQNYQSGNIKIAVLDASNAQINIVEDIAIVATTIHLKGKYLEHQLDHKYRYTRVWKKFIQGWQVIAGSCVQLL